MTFSTWMLIVLVTATGGNMTSYQVEHLASSAECERVAKVISNTYTSIGRPGNHVKVYPLCIEMEKTK